MDGFNRPPTVAEDTLEYILYPGPAFHDKPTVITLATTLDSNVASLLPNHIWHKDSFEVNVVGAPYDSKKWIIRGRMRFGDSVDDEWCVVWLLKYISERWDVVVSVFDTDGEFLLIEAAQNLPAWVTPTNSENRVWIYKGHLHLVPLHHVSPPTTKRERRRSPLATDSDDEYPRDVDDDENYISILDAIELVRNPSVDTFAAADLESAALRRIDGYPTSARQHIHNTKAHLPRDIVIALSNNPSLIQKAIEAFYTRDAIQLRAASRMARFSPSSSILSTVAMTRVAYAQLMGQLFHPPKVFGQWKEQEGTLEWRWKDVGMKIACGFEMLYQESKRRKGVTSNEADGGSAMADARKDALRRDAQYTTYIRRLHDAGYFHGEIEGSAIWKEREDRAAAMFVKSRQAEDGNRPSFAFVVDLAISQGESNLPQHINRQEDSEEWLAIDESNIDNMLRDSFSSKTSGGDSMEIDEREVLENRLATEQAQQLRNLAEKVEMFVQGQGRVEGALFEDDPQSDDDLSNAADSDDATTSDSQIEDTKRETDAERQAAMDKLVPALEPSEYGKMPPDFYSNSQRVKPVTFSSDTAHVEHTSEQDDHPQQKPMRPLIFPRDQFDGAEDSDDESEEVGVDEDGEDGEEQPVVVGDVDIDMKDEEEEFLEFSRDALGITPDMWKDIVKDRKERGAFLPASALLQEAEETQDSRVLSSARSTVTFGSRQAKSDLNQSWGTNRKLDSFEAVMQAMDAELSLKKRSKQTNGAKEIPGTPQVTRHESSKAKGKQRAEADDDEDVETAMETELQAALRDESDDDSQEEADTSADYTLIKNFLESFKSQSGLSGPVSNLLGRLQPGWTLPRDES